MKVYGSLVFLWIVLLKALTTTEIDYYWKDYNGDIPTDAFQAGIDISGNPIYIGQGFFLNIGLLPATLHSGSTCIKVTARNGVFATNKSVKILCCQNSEKLQWIPANYNNISFLTNSHPIIGGLETNTNVYIGRTIHERSLEIGKIYNVAPFQGLALPNIQQTESRYLNFEILTYKMDFPSEIWENIIIH